MKAYVKMIPAAMVAIALAGCADEAAQDEPLRFNFNLSSTDYQNGSDLPDDASLLVSLETPSGDNVYSLENISFSRSGNEYITQGLDLQPGEYVLSEFMLVDNDGKILYTIPYVNSPLTNAVARPLGTNFVVASASKEEIQAEILDARKRKPSEFGMASFYVKNSFQIVVNEEERGKPVSATAAVLDGSDTVAIYSLPGKKSRIAFDGDKDKEYTLVVARDACAAYSETFTLQSWSTAYRSKAKKVTLQPAFTMTAKGYANPEYPFYFYLGGTEGSISVNWGDGHTETYALGNDFEVKHEYAATASYPITITGDLDKITYFYSFYGGSEFTEIHFKHLINLNEIRYGLTYGPGVLDLSHNVNLEYAMLPSLLSMHTLKLPASHGIKFIEIDGSNQLDGDDVNAIIDNIHTNAVAGGIHDGVFGLRAYWAQEDDDHSMVGDPSALSLQKLDELKNSFGWIINPGQPATKLTTDGRIRLSRMNL